MSSFYKMDPAAWDYGTASLTLEEEAAYLRIVNAINKHDAPVPHVDRVLAGMFRVSTRKARALLQALVDAGKVYIEDGKIWNERARSEVVHRQFASISASESGAKGGRKRAERAAKALKKNKQAQANPSSRIEENRIDTDTYVSDGDAVDIRKTVWDRGVPFLVKRGTREQQARSLLGKWLKSNTPAEVFAALSEASSAKTGDPVPYITEVLKGHEKPSREAARLQAFIAGAVGET